MTRAGGGKPTAAALYFIPPTARGATSLPLVPLALHARFLHYSLLINMVTWPFRVIHPRTCVMAASRVSVTVNKQGAANSQECTGRRPAMRA